MLAATISDEIRKKKTFIFLDDNKRISGFSYCNGKFVPVDKKSFSVLYDFYLSEDYKNLDSVDGYETKYDLNSGLLHFFKNSCEDVEQLYKFNGECYTLFSIKGRNSSSNIAKKFKIGAVAVVFTSLACFTALFSLLPSKHTVFYNNQYVTVQYNLLFESPYFIYNGERYEFKTQVTAQDIKDLIYGSSKLKDDEKNFLWNEELINDIIPYYDGYASIQAQIRHKDIDIVDFTEEEKRWRADDAGFNNGDNLLHIQDYNPDYLRKDVMNFFSMTYQYEIFNNSTATAHEYVHSLETNWDYRMIIEPLAEMISQEYFFDSGAYPQSGYNTAINYLRVLIEIVGPEVIWDNTFREDSTALFDSVKPYFSDDELWEFMSIMLYPPTHFDRYDDYKRLLGTLYENKFGRSMDEDETIQAIFESSEFNKFYFRKSMMETNKPFYRPYKTMRLEEANEAGIVSFYAYVDSPNSDDIEMIDGEKSFFVMERKSNVLSEDITIEDGKILGTVTLDDGNGGEYTVSLKTAESLGYIWVSYDVEVEITYEEFLSHDLPAPSMRTLCFVTDNNYKGWKYNYEKNVIEPTNQSDVIYLDSEKDVKRFVYSD